MGLSIHGKPIKAINAIKAYSYTQLYISLIPARSRSGRIPVAKTRPKLHEQLGKQAFRRDVRELVGGWNMEDPDLSQGHLFVNKVDVDLDVLRASMMDNVGSHVDRTDIVAIDKCC